jgi:hypothetical protein
MDFPNSNPSTDPEENLPNPSLNPDGNPPDKAGVASTKINRSAKRHSIKPWWILVVVFTYLVGLGSGFMVWGSKTADVTNSQSDSSEMKMLAEQVNPKDGYILPVSFGDLGPQMVEAGVIDRDLFIEVYKQAGQPLSGEQLGILDGAYTGSAVMNLANAYFLLNFLWALGLSSQNPILDSGPIQQNNDSGIEGFASTGGWTLATRPVGEIYSSLKTITLTAEQQQIVEEAAAAVHRPCCDNPTHFPDCNHGMAMLGLLELMASQNVSLEKMLEAAKYVNAFWYPQQALEQAVYFQKVEGKAFQDVDPRTILGLEFSSGSGFARLHQFLGEKGLLPQAPASGGSCGV